MITNKVGLTSDDRLALPLDIDDWAYHIIDPVVSLCHPHLLHHQHHSPEIKGKVELI